MSRLDELPESLQHELSLLGYENNGHDYRDENKNEYGGYSRISILEDGGNDRERKSPLNGITSYGSTTDNHAV